MNAEKIDEIVHQVRDVAATDSVMHVRSLPLLVGLIADALEEVSESIRSGEVTSRLQLSLFYIEKWRLKQIEEQIAGEVTAKEVETPDILVILNGGLVQGVSKTDPDIRVIVRDYDIEGTDENDPHVSKDPQGILCCEQEW